LPYEKSFSHVSWGMCLLTLRIINRNRVKNSLCVRWAAAGAESRKESQTEWLICDLPSSENTTELIVHTVNTTENIETETFRNWPELN